MNRLLILLLPLLMLTGCVTSTPQQATGTMLGMQLGSVVGGAVGHASMRGPDGHFWGTAIGAVAGAVIGNSLNSPERAAADDTDYSSTDDYSAKSNDSKRGERYKQIERSVAAESSWLPVDVSNVVLKTEDGDKVLSGAEYAKLSFDITNVSDYTLHEVIPYIKCDNADIEFSAITAINDLHSGNGVRYTVSLYATNGLRDGMTDVIIAISVDGSEYRVVYKTKFLTKKK